MIACGTIFSVERQLVTITGYVKVSGLAVLGMVSF
jgi:hypothetical protein